MPFGYEYHRNLTYQGFIITTNFMAWKHSFFFKCSNYLAFISMLLQALHANALPVLDMCKQWLAQYM